MAVHEPEPGKLPPIPRIIHQTFHAPPWPDGIRENVERLKRLNPGWEHRFYDDDGILAYIERCYGRGVLDLYRSIEPRYGAARADLFRYLVMHREGGVYLDIKAAAEKPFDTVLRDDDAYLLSRWHSGREGAFAGWGLHPALGEVGGAEFQQWFIVCAPGHPFLTAVIDRVTRTIAAYRPERHGTGKYATVHVTGPIAYTLAIAPLLADHPHRMVDYEDLGLVYSIFDTDGSRRHERIFQGHYATQHHTPLVRMGRARFLIFRLLRKAGVVGRGHYLGG